MVLRWGRNGEYLVCSGRPECKNKKNVEVDKDGKITVLEETFHGVCPTCGGNLVEKTGRFGRFIACANYPTCKFTKSISLGFQCPLEGCTGGAGRTVAPKRRGSSMGAAGIPNARLPRVQRQKRAIARAAGLRSCSAPREGHSVYGRTAVGSQRHRRWSCRDGSRLSVGEKRHRCKPLRDETAPHHACP